jgi:hypothetical protein
VTESVRSRDDALASGLLTQAAWVGVLALALGHAFAPALPGAGEGMGRLIEFFDAAGNLSTYLFAFLAIGATVLVALRTGREHRIGAAYRIIAAALAALVLATVGPALHGPLSLRAGILGAAASVLLALMAGWHGMSSPRTRALGFVLAATAIAAALHLGGLLLLVRSEGRASTTASVLATLALGFDAIALGTALAWLGTRSRSTLSPGTALVTMAAFGLTWVALRGGREPADVWQVVVHRAVQRLLGAPQPLVAPPFRYALEIAAPLLAVAALMARRQIPAVTAALALALVARPTTDIPLSALALTLAALATNLAAHDDRGFWSTLVRTSTPVRAESS